MKNRYCSLANDNSLRSVGPRRPCIRRRRNADRDSNGDGTADLRTLLDGPYEGPPTPARACFGLYLTAVSRLTQSSVTPCCIPQIDLDVRPPTILNR